MKEYQTHWHSLKLNTESKLHSRLIASVELLVSSGHGNISGTPQHDHDRKEGALYVSNIAIVELDELEVNSHIVNSPIFYCINRSRHIMAPALVETAAPDVSKLSLKQHAIQNGHNKEGFIGSPLEFNKDGELKGTEHQPAASFPKYLPVWDNETSK